MNDTALPTLPDTHDARPGDLARKLGYAGLVPFIGGALFVFLLAVPGHIGEDAFSFVVRALSCYAALVIAFLGGIPWGLVMWRSATGQTPPEAHRRALWTGIVYTLSAWIALLMPPHAGLVVMGALLIACYLTDRKRYPELGVAGWLTLRFRLTVVASMSCFLAAAQI